MERTNNTQIFILKVTQHWKQIPINNGLVKKLWGTYNGKLCGVKKGMIWIHL